MVCLFVFSLSTEMYLYVHVNDMFKPDPCFQLFPFSSGKSKSTSKLTAHVLVTRDVEIIFYIK